MSRTKQTPKGDYEVGYGKPPVSSRFQPGQSGNRQGRPKKETTIRGAIEMELRRARVVRIDGKEQRLTHAEIIAKQIVKQGMEGKPQSLAQLLKLQPELAGVIAAEAKVSRAEGEGTMADDALGATDLAMMQWYVEAMSTGAGAAECEQTQGGASGKSAP